jgi:hypothetical protein
MDGNALEEAGSMTQPDSYPIVAIAIEVVRMLATFDGSGLNVSEEPRQPNPAREEFGVVDQDIDERLDLTMRMELLDNAMGALPTEAVASAGGKMATGASQRTQTAPCRAT